MMQLPGLPKTETIYHILVSLSNQPLEYAFENECWLDHPEQIPKLEVAFTTRNLSAILRRR